jgi:hypothetical protein
MSRNQERVLSDAMINRIKSKIYNELLSNSVGRSTVVDTLMDAYLMDSKDELMEATIALIEATEDNILSTPSYDELLTINMELNEDSYDTN